MYNLGQNTADVITDSKQREPHTTTRYLKMLTSMSREGCDFTFLVHYYIDKLHSA